MSDIAYRLSESNAKELARKIIELTAYEWKGFYRGNDHNIDTIDNLINEAVDLMRHEGLVIEPEYKYMG